jgi:serine/threonine protein kinase
VATDEAGSAQEPAALLHLSLTRTGASVGTPSYLSPEQIRGERLDGRTDLFSFGLVLYELVTGQRAFSGETATAIRNAVVNVLAAPIRKLNPDVPVELETIIGKALEKDRGRRYQSAREMRADLERLRASLKPRSPALRISVGAAAVLLAGIAWGIYTTFPERPPFQKIEMMQLTNQGRGGILLEGRARRVSGYGR